MTEFKTELQKLIDDAAEKRCEDFMSDHEKNYFKAGCDFLMPMIDSLIKCRDVLLHENDKLLNYEKMKLSDRNDKDLINLIRGTNDNK